MITNDYAGLHEKLNFLRNASGAIQSPRTPGSLPGCEDDAARMAAPFGQALKIARFLKGAYKVTTIHYPWNRNAFRSSVALKQAAERSGGR